MQIFEHQHHGVLGGDRINRFAHLPQHPFPCDSSGFPLQRFQLWYIQERGHLHQPRGGILIEQLNKRLSSSWFPAQSAQRFQDRHKRLAWTIVFDTLPPAHPDTRLWDGGWGIE
jgi:hypothetical protein